MPALALGAALLPFADRQPIVILELRNSDDARTYLVQGVWLSRLVAVPGVKTLATSLRLAGELLAVGEPLPPPGLMIDVDWLVRGESHASTHAARTTIGAEQLSGDVVQRYEDYVLGKLYADGGFERGATAICRYAEKDRLRGTAWLIAKFAERAGIDSVHLSPNVVRTLLNAPREDVLAEGAESLRTEGLLPTLAEAYQRMVEQVRQLGDVLGAEDVFELEHATVLVEFGQRIALRQMLQMAARLEAALPARVPHVVSRHRNVPTHLLDEDMYPVGGFTSISTHGTIESLLHSQLAYMEPPTEPRPDLFDIKFLRGELLYYARDENEFLRRRRTFVFLLSPDLVEARLKDIALPCQRIVLVLASVLTCVRKLLSWLSDEALQIEILVMAEGDSQPLEDERALLAMALADQMANGTVSVDTIMPEQVATHVAAASHRSLTTVVEIGMRESAAVATVAQLRLRVNQASPRLITSEGMATLEPDEVAGWPSAVTQLMHNLLLGPESS